MEMEAGLQFTMKKSNCHDNYTICVTVVCKW